MPRSFRSSRFRRTVDMSEDVNPSAYIVNLADCMLVLACGFMVAMIAFWNIDIGSVEELRQEQLEQVNPETMPEDIVSAGSYYVDAGKVYRDPATGDLFMVTEGEGGSQNSDEVNSSSATGSGNSDSASSTSGEDSTGSAGGNIPSRAAGAD